MENHASEVVNEVDVVDIETLKQYANDSLDLHRKRPTLKPLRNANTSEVVKKVDSEKLPNHEGIFSINFK